MKFIQQSSPNYNERNNDISALIIHYTGMKTGNEALQRLCCKKSEVSAHYLINETGFIYKLVDENKRAWHAGVSSWGGISNVNDYSIGIELVNKGEEFGYEKFPIVQMQSLISLCSDILIRYKILPQNIIGHSDIAPTRKADPGELFDWSLLAANNIGKFPHQNKNLLPMEAEELTKYGYEIDNLRASIIAFQRHFRPKNICGIWDRECGLLLADLLQK